MSAEIMTALIGVSGGAAIAGLTYWFTKKRERDAELRREKLEHYKDFTASLSGVISGESNAEGQKNYARACNKLMLIAPQPVIEALRDFQDEVRISNPNKDSERHDRLMSKLFYEIRRDLGTSPGDDAETFRVRLFASGVRTVD